MRVCFRLITVFVLLLSACTKSVDSTETAASAPPLSSILLTTNDVTSINSYSAVTGGTIIDAGGNPLTEKGVCYSTHTGPTISDTKIVSLASTVNFPITLTGLNVNTIYYVRAYASTASGVSYGNEQVFKAVLVLGQAYQGGVLYYLSATSDSGLIAAPADQSTAAPWGCSGTAIVIADGQAKFTGKANTDSIVHQCSTSGIAAALCKSLIIGGFSDWYLPSTVELTVLYQNRRAVGGLANVTYWSSTQYAASSQNNAYYCDFANSASILVGTKSSPLHVRAIRAFHSN